MLLERGVSLAASVARWACERRFAVGLVATGSFPDAPRTIRVGAGNNPDQLNAILEALSAITAFTVIDMAAALEDPRHPLPSGATVVLITGLVTETTEAALRRLRAGGHVVHVLKTDRRDWGRDLSPIPVQHMADVMEPLERAAIEAGLTADPAESWA